MKNILFLFNARVLCVTVVVSLLVCIGCSVSTKSAEEAIPIRLTIKTLKSADDAHLPTIVIEVQNIANQPITIQDANGVFLGEFNILQSTRSFETREPKIADLTFHGAWYPKQNIVSPGKSLTYIVDLHQTVLGVPKKAMELDGVITDLRDKGFNPSSDYQIQAKTNWPGLQVDTDVFSNILRVENR